MQEDSRRTRSVSREERSEERLFEGEPLPKKEAFFYRS
jgi:hypothetical protein